MSKSSSKMDWVPVVFMVLKALVFCTGMFFPIKWHCDEGKAMDKRALLRASGKVAAVFMLLLLCLMLLPYGLATSLGTDLRHP